MEYGFMGGSMGSVVGEKFVRACDSAIAASPVMTMAHVLEPG
jgi:acetyl-CoA carboxylase beta subunit